MLLTTLDGEAKMPMAPVPCSSVLGVDFIADPICRPLGIFASPPATAPAACCEAPATASFNRHSAVIESHDRPRLSAIGSMPLPVTEVIRIRQLDATRDDRLYTYNPVIDAASANRRCGGGRDLAVSTSSLPTRIYGLARSLR